MKTTLFSRSFHPNKRSMELKIYLNICSYFGLNWSVNVYLFNDYYWWCARRKRTHSIKMKRKRDEERNKSTEAKPKIMREYMRFIDFFDKVLSFLKIFVKNSNTKKSKHKEEQQRHIEIQTHTQTERQRSDNQDKKCYFPPFQCDFPLCVKCVSLTYCAPNRK